MEINLSRKEGFTLVEVIVAIAILAFSVLATVRIVTASLSSILGEGKRVNAHWLGIACMKRLEGEKWERIPPEVWIITDKETGDFTYRLNLSLSTQLVIRDDPYWYDTTSGLGISPSDGQDDGVLVVGERNVFTRVTTSPSSGEYNFDPSTFTFTFSSQDVGKEVHIYYRYYTFIDEGGTIPPSLTLQTVAQAEWPWVEEVHTRSLITPISYVSLTREVSFQSADVGKCVWIRYLPKWESDSDGDGYEDPTLGSIVGVVKGAFWDPEKGKDTSLKTQVKHLQVLMFWKEKELIKDLTEETYIVR